MSNSYLLVQWGCLYSRTILASNPQWYRRFCTTVTLVKRPRMIGWFFSFQPPQKVVAPPPLLYRSFCNKIMTRFFWILDTTVQNSNGCSENGLKLHQLAINWTIMSGNHRVKSFVIQTLKSQFCMKFYPLWSQLGRIIDCHGQFKMTSRN